MSQQVHTRHVGDTRLPLGVTLTRPDGTAVDLTGLTVNFRMVAEDATDKVAETASNVTITDAASGQVQYDFQSGDVDTVGTFYAYFRIVESAEKDTFPVPRRKLVVRIEGP